MAFDYWSDLKKIYDRAYNDALNSIPVMSNIFNVDRIRDNIENEKDFYLGAVITTIHFLYSTYATSEKFTREQIESTSPLMARDIIEHIPDIKKNIESNIGI